MTWCENWKAVTSYGRWFLTNGIATALVSKSMQCSGYFQSARAAR